MNRNNEFNKIKIISISTAKTVVDVYADYFQYERVRIMLSEYEGKKASVDAYIEFSDFIRIASQVFNKEIFKKIQKSGGKGVELYRGGTSSAKAKREDGKATSKTLSINMSDTGTVFLNAVMGPGRETGKGAIIPDGAPDAKVSVSMTYDDCLALFMYTDAAVRQYMPIIFSEIFTNVAMRQAQQ